MTQLHTPTVFEKIKAFVLLMLTIAWTFFPSASALANQYGSLIVENVVSGDVHFQQNGSTTQITASNQSIINYHQFDIGLNETVQFIQPHQAATVLNRVTAIDNPSEILGNLTANGQVYLVNPAGIYFGQGSVVNTGALLAIAGNMTDKDFVNGLNESLVNLTGNIENLGTIKTIDESVLMGLSVFNSGNIVSDRSSVVMVAGDRVLFGEDRDGHVFVDITSFNELNETRVENAGFLSAAKGRVLLAAGDALGMASIVHGGAVEALNTRLQDQSAIVHSGTIEAQSVRIEDQSSGVVLVTGDIEASESVHVTGETLLLRDKATISASDKFGGGEILIGGDQEGSNPEKVRNAENVFVGKDVTLSVDAKISGQGGRLITYAGQQAIILGKLTARGAKGAEGGFIETSGKEFIVVAKAPKVGKDGTWLIDPYNIEIVDIGSSNIDGSTTDLFFAVGNNAKLGVDLITAALADGGSVIIRTDDDDDSTNDGTQNGDITINSVINYDGVIDGQSLTFSAARDIIINDTTGAVVDSTIDTTGLNLILSADSDGDGDGDVRIDNTIDIGAGTFTAEGHLIRNSQSSSFAGGDTTAAHIVAGTVNLTSRGGRIGGTDGNPSNPDPEDNPLNITTAPSSTAPIILSADSSQGGNGNNMWLAVVNDSEGNVVDLEISQTNAGTGDVVLTSGGAVTFNSVIADKLDISGVTTDSNIDLSVVTVNSLIGSGSDTLTGTAGVDNFTIDSANGGSISGSASTSFTGISSINGGSDDDTFTMGENGSLSGTLDGGTGIDTLDYASRIDGIDDIVAIDLDSNTATSVTGGFSNLETFVGNGASTTTLTGTISGDNFVVGSGSVSSFGVSSLTLNGNGSDDGDTLIGTLGADLFLITGADAGSVDTVEFSSIENLAGGDEDDTFRMGENGSLGGTIDGGAGADTLDYSLRIDGTDDTVAIDLGFNTATSINGGFSNLESFTGNGASATLTGTELADTFTITGADSGTVSDGTTTYNFSAIENLNGASGDDAITFNTSSEYTYSLRFDGGADTNSASFDPGFTINGDLEISNVEDFILDQNLIVSGLLSLSVDGEINIPDDDGIQTEFGSVTFNSESGNVIIHEDDSMTIVSNVNNTVTGRDILLSSNGSLTLSAPVNSSGNVSILAENEINQNANITTGGETAGTVDIESFSSSIAMADQTIETASNGGNIRYASSGNITLGLLNAVEGNVSITTNGGNIDEVTSGEDINIIANYLRLESTTTNGSIGSSDTNGGLDVQVTTLSSLSGGSTYIYNQGDLTIDNTNGSVSVTRVSSTESKTDDALSLPGSAGGDYTIIVDGSLNLDGDGSSSSIETGGSQTYIYSQKDNSSTSESRFNFQNNYTLNAGGNIEITANRTELLAQETIVSDEGATTIVSPISIISDGFDITIDAGGEFVMGQFEKMSIGGVENDSGDLISGGNLIINAIDAYVADISVQGDLDITLSSGSGSLFIVEREPEVIFDEGGADVAVAGKLTFSGSSIQGTEGGAIQDVIAIGGGEVDRTAFVAGANVFFGTLDPAELFVFGPTFDNVARVIASLQFFPYVVNPQIFEVEPGEQRVPEALREELLKLRIFARELSEKEKRYRREKGYVYTDQIVTDELAPISAYEVALTRISASVAQDTVDFARNLMGADGENLPVISETIGLAFGEFIESNPDGTAEDFAHHLSVSTSEAATEAFEYVNRFNQLFEKIGSMGLTETELSISRRNILSRLKVDGLRGREMIELFDSFVLAKETELSLSIQ